MKFYIASSLKNIENVRRVAENLKVLGFNIRTIGQHIRTWTPSPNSVILAKKRFQEFWLQML